MAVGTATVDFGATPVEQATFSITDAALIALTYVEPFFMSSDSTADNDANAHEMAGHLIEVVAGAPDGAGTFAVIANVLLGQVTGQFKLRYGAS